MWHHAVWLLSTNTSEGPFVTLNTEVVDTFLTLPQRKHQPLTSINITLPALATKYIHKQFLLLQCFCIVTPLVNINEWNALLGQRKVTEGQKAVICWEDETHNQSVKFKTSRRDTVELFGLNCWPYIRDNASQQRVNNVLFPMYTCGGECRNVSVYRPLWVQHTVNKPSNCTLIW